MMSEGSESDRIFSIPGTLSYVLVKDGEIYLVTGNWARSLASTRVLVKGGICYDTQRHGSFTIFGSETPSWWNELELIELPMSYFKLRPRPMGQAGYTVNRLQLSAC
jgi:hypothetical protein